MRLSDAVVSTVTLGAVLVRYAYNCSNFKKASPSESPHMEHSIADLDDDGFPDLVFLKGPADRAMVMWGSQAGFHVDNRTDLPVEGPSSSSIADLNRDGSLDIFFVKTQKTIYFTLLYVVD